MKFNDIKAPKHLKHKTIAMMEKQIKPKTKNRYMKGTLIMACIPMLFTLTAFSYSLFSGIDGDELSLNTNYKGNGVVEITVENLANKNLQFNETIRLELWSTSEQIFKSEQDMPIIKSGESSVITIEIPQEYVVALEEPLFDSDHYIFWLTTNNFINGQSWMASVSFSENIPTTQDEPTSPPVVPVEDNTSQDDISIIKDHFEYQNPLEVIDISQDYNSFGVGDDGYFHAEIDLAAEADTDIYSFSSGTIVSTGFDDAIGLFIVIDHGDGLFSRYTHCSEIFYDVDETITMEDVIAKVGTTGMATGPHLGFSIILNDVPINPKTILSFE